MPAHIRAVDLPTGIYWDRARHHWYTILADVDGKRRVKLGDAHTKLADLQLRLTDVRDIDRDSLDWLMGAFAASPEHARLAERTQRDYARYRAAIAAYPTRAGKLGTLPAARLSTPLFQGIVDRLEQAGTPTKANHWLRYLRRVYSFALRRTSIKMNPCRGVAQAHERARRVVPDEATYERVLAFARTSRAVMPYVPAMMELMYLCRLRSVEAIELTDANALDAGVRTNRHKGSRDNIVAWSPRLRGVWSDAIEHRRTLYAKRHIPVPLQPERRTVLVGQSGQPVSRNAARIAWQHLMQRAIAAGVIEPAQRFGTHACKHKGVTDTPGNRHDKQEASGLRSERMMDVYDHSVPIVPTAEPKA